MAFTDKTIAARFVDKFLLSSIDEHFDEIEKSVAIDISRATGYAVPDSIAERPTGNDGATGLFDFIASIMVAYRGLLHADGLSEGLVTNITNTYNQAVKSLAYIRAPEPIEQTSATSSVNFKIDREAW